MQEYVLQYFRVALGRDWPSVFFFFGGTNFTHAHIRFDTAEIRPLNRCRISVG